MFTILIPKIKSLVTKESIKGLMLLIFWILVYCVFLFFILRFTLIQTNVNNNANLIVKQISALERDYMIIHV